MLIIDFNLFKINFFRIVMPGCLQNEKNMLYYLKLI